MSQPKIIRMNQNTGRKDDDKFVFVTEGHAMEGLKYQSTSTVEGGYFENYTFESSYQPLTKVQRFVGDDDSYWLIMHPDGGKYYYGGEWGKEDPNNYSDDFKQACRHIQKTGNLAGSRCQSGAIEYGVTWGLSLIHISEPTRPY